MPRHLISALLVAAGLITAQASWSLASSFGTLSNFDVINDTGSSCHGFEIELEDLHSSDVSYTFGGTYIRYGSPEVVETTSDPAHPHVIVRYRHWTGSEWAATPVAPAGISASGHDCYSGGPVGNYLTSGCEHFGVSLRNSPTRTTYRWLVAADPADVNTAFMAVPENVNLPVPVWNVIPRGGGGVDVRAEVEPVEEENHAQYGEPQWLKVFKVESDLDLQPEDLNKLLLGIAGGIVPDETEIETEWKLIQSKPGNAEGVNEDADVKQDPLDAGKRSVIRRYEFYAYTGPRDGENNEAMPCVADDTPVPEGAPVNGCSDLGDFAGAQNVAVDVDLAAVDNNLPDGEVGVPYPDPPLVIGGLAPYSVELTGGTVPDGLQIDPVTGVLSGTPTQGGAFSFSIRATDALADVVTGTFDVTIIEDLCPSDPDKTAPGACGCGVPDDDSDGDGTPNCLDLCPDDPDKTAPGACGCNVAERTCGDLCPEDPSKTAPGICGCGVPDTDSDGDGTADCQDFGQDLAVSSITVPGKVSLSARKPKRIKIAVRIQNRGPASETIPDPATLASLVSLTIESLGGCPSPVALFDPPTQFPIVLKSKKKLRVSFEVTFACANDPLKTTKKDPGHDDFRVIGTVNRAVLGGPDTHPTDDVCPRTVTPPWETDPNPDGTIKDKGCGKKLGKGAFGGAIQIDVVEKN